MKPVELLRSDTPACRELLHFNNAGSSLQPRPVTDAVLQHLLLEQRLGGYEAAQANAEAGQQFYTAFAALLNCNPREIAYVENASRGWNLLLQAIPFDAGDHIVTGVSEYASNYLSLLHLAKTKGLVIDVIPNSASGQIDLEKLEDALDDKVRLVALTHIPSQSGVIHPAAEVGRLCQQRRILFLLDACQSAGQTVLDVNEIQCDMLTGSGRKYLRGPRGTGFMYVRHSILDFLKPATVDLSAISWLQRNHFEWRDDARRFELFEHYVAGKIGLAVAAQYAVDNNMIESAAVIQRLGHRLRQQLASIVGVRIHDSGFIAEASQCSHLGGIVTFNTPLPAETLQQRLQTQRINSSVLRQRNTRLEFEDRGLGDINRASVHYFNTETEIARFCDAVEQAIA
ncbi:MAG TPA: aminotransferase [Pseudohongiella sp.]|nr:aminotransferase [Pseudohongiella sp.]HBX37229.1 aminotransferase [Pseudohongiella sp.]|tara:strand:+ start:2360 stop:3556 length:1197 start_codon:yes stop_codon:yes gene_type:complete